MKKVYLVRPEILPQQNSNPEIEQAAIAILHRVSEYLNEEIEEVTSFLPEMNSALGNTIAKLKSMAFADYVVFVEGWGNDALRACADECGLEILDVTNTKEAA